MAENAEAFSLYCNVVIDAHAYQINRNHAELSPHWVYVISGMLWMVDRREPPYTRCMRVKMDETGRVSEKAAVGVESIAQGAFQ